MKVKGLFKKAIGGMTTVAVIACMLFNPAATMSVHAGSTTSNPGGKLYEFDKDGKYDISAVTPSTISSTTDYGSFSIKGDMTSITAVNGFTAYEVKDGNVTLNYSVGTKYANAASTDWHLYDDKSKKINGEEFESNILSGGLVLQTSLDGTNWVTDKYLSNIATDANYVPDFYITKDIQQVNGCYYRILVVYELEKQVEDGNVWFVSYDKFEYKKCAEVYSFYLINSSENMSNGTPSTATPKKNLGSLTNTGKDNGYSGQNAITNKDPHYGWEIGQFFVNGYTRETQDNVTGTPIFLKNVGDRVTLWFNLKQDITCLNGNANLQISEDKNGYDQYFQTGQTNMKRGTLIIRYTDYEGVRHDPIIYTDYLAANARTGADTKVELFEEGDYEVALDYEIVDKSGVDSYTNYRIFFTFSIRNGNCMVYPFDITSGAELQDNAITENGFKLDMAKSRYLTIDVKRTVLVNGTNGRTEDVRFNRPAKDGDQYKDEGIYTFTVTNLYTNETTIKTIYVGTDPFLRALSRTGLSVKELEGKLAEGYTIDTNGSLIEPVIEEPEEPEEPAEVEPEETIEEAEVDENVKPEAAAENNTESQLSEKTVDETTDEAPEEELTEEKTTNTGMFVIIAVILVAAAGVAVYASKVSKGKKEEKVAMTNVETPLEEDDKNNGGDAE